MYADTTNGHDFSIGDLSHNAWLIIGVISPGTIVKCTSYSRYASEISIVKAPDDAFMYQQSSHIDKTAPFWEIN